MSSLPPLRQPCPPGACDCGREHLHAHPPQAQRILLLTRHEEKRLIERLENLESLEDLQRLQARLYDQLGIRVSVAPGANEVRTMRGFVIELEVQPGLCRRTRQAIPAAIRRGLERNPQVAFRLLDAHDLLGDG
ncbi:hypothetical protein IAE35_20220 [Pseudomonas sp. S75]|uniref:hypothetical protein n=1 Tax=unclassified Pseudomonas TaxID=196821 RepID=UPI001902D0A2|nr:MULTISPECIES: hypothetical protein [unclassified Pseudomonas]MBJ9976428.1 hypothetical protein [Pseudomonas sp. S30]MBK0155672.1 hypothetical protein [Pseudomonas sp. S75]